MIDPQHVIVQCPNGHELQAAREHLSTRLSCPMCGVEFVPQPAAPTDAPAAPVTYAGDLLSQPVTFPGVTPWMLWIWVTYYLVSLVSTALMLVLGPKVGMQAGQPPKFDLATGAFMTVASCLTLILMLAGIVTQLMWIYTIHKDAHRARRYSDVSPGLAVGLSLIPILNYVWTAWTMRKLSSFVAASGAGGEPESTSQVAGAQSATRANLIMGVVIVAFSCILMGMGAMRGFEAFQTASSGGQFDQVAFQTAMAEAVPAWANLLSSIVWMIAVIVYFAAVRRLEAALYPFLGAPPR